jgi:hypothetical protein
MTPGTPMTISFKQTLIPPATIPKTQLIVHNTHGMKPSSRNAFREKGVPERYVCIVLIKARLPGNSTRK